MDFKVVSSLSDITEVGNYECQDKRFTIEFEKDFCGLDGYNLTGYYGKNGTNTEIYCKDFVNVYQCKKLKTILKHVQNLRSFWINK